MQRGLSAELARQVAEELTAKDVVRAHARDELGIDIDELANPFQVGRTGRQGHTGRATWAGGPGGLNLSMAVSLTPLWGAPLHVHQEAVASSLQQAMHAAAVSVDAAPQQL